MTTQQEEKLAERLFWSCIYHSDHKHGTQEEATLCSELRESYDKLQEVWQWLKEQPDTSTNEKEHADRTYMLGSMAVRLHLMERFFRP